MKLAIDQLSKRFGKTVALDRVSLEVAEGEIFFLLGPSGCGKTTLLRAIAGFHLPDSGRILFDGEDVTHLPAHRRETAMVFQSYALWPHLDAGQNIAFGLKERRTPAAEVESRVKAALDSVRMPGLERRRIHELSGGQQQRIALARALVVRPRCILLDEPLSNLDAKLRIEMRLEIRRICREAGLTAIYVTHDQKEALSIADRMAVLNEGRIAQIGPPDEVYRRPANRFVAEFMGGTNFLPGRVVAVENGIPKIQTPLGVLQGAETTLPPSAEALVSLRPESLQIGDGEAPAGFNAISGRFSDRVYLGETAQFTFVPDAAPEHALTVVECNPRREHTAGRAVTLHIRPEDVVLLPP